MKFNLRQLGVFKLFYLLIIVLVNPLSAVAESCPEIGGFDFYSPPAPSDECDWEWFAPTHYTSGQQRFVDGNDAAYDPHWISVDKIVITTAPYIDPNDCKTADDDACDGSNTPDSGDDFDVEDRPQPIWNPADRPKPQKCYTIQLDFAKCKQKAEGDYLDDVVSVCPVQTATALGSTAVVMAIAGYIFRDRESSVTAGELLAGGAAFVTIGNFVYDSCDKGYQKTRDATIAACAVDQETDAISCSQYQ